MTTHIPAPDDRYGGFPTVREEKSLEWLVDPTTPVVFEPQQPGESDMPNSGGGTDGGGTDLTPTQTAE